MPTIAYQLYCSRNFPPLGDTLSMLSRLGYSYVEGFGGLYDDPAGLRAQLDAAGLQMPTGHFGLDVVEGDPSHAIHVAKTLGMTHVFVPHIAAEMRPVDTAGWRAFGERLAAAGKPIIDAGLGFGWHNHDFEMVAGDDGITPLEAMMDAAPSLNLELDLGWVQRAGHDPVEWINKYAGRISAAHIKDIAPTGECADEDGWADVGHGTMDWPAITAALAAARVSRFVIEHDNPRDHERFARRSLATASTF
ncbi:MAG: sugar phosphate isomerase/epimerase [Octadecabacter sp.]